MGSREVVLVTGANTGLGYQIIRALCNSGKSYDIILAGRSLDKVQAAVKSAEDEFPSSKISALQVDLDSDESIEKAFEEVKSKFGKVDALVNNAGTQLDQQHAAGKMTMRDMWNQSWNVNTTGTQIVTHTFMPLLLQSANPRILFLTSGTATLAGSDNTALAVNKILPKGWPKGNFDGKSSSVPAYRSVKTGLNMMMREWHRMLKEDGVKVWSISPGLLATGLGGDPEKIKAMGAADPSVGANFIVSVIEGKRDDDVGKAINKDGIQAW